MNDVKHILPYLIILGIVVIVAITVLISNNSSSSIDESSDAALAGEAFRFKTSVANRDVRNVLVRRSSGNSLESVDASLLELARTIQEQQGGAAVRGGPEDGNPRARCCLHCCQSWSSDSPPQCLSHYCCGENSC